MRNDQLSGTRSNRKGHGFVCRFAAAAAISVGVLGVTNMQSAGAATPCASIFDLCYVMPTAGIAPQVGPTVGFGAAFNTANQAALYSMQQTDMLQAQTIFAQVSVQSAAQAAQNWQTMQTSQTSIFAYTQDVTATKALRATAAFNLMDGYLRSDA